MTSGLIQLARRHTQGRFQVPVLRSWAAWFQMRSRCDRKDTVRRNWGMCFDDEGKTGTGEAERCAQARRKERHHEDFISRLRARCALSLPRERRGHDAPSSLGPKTRQGSLLTPHVLSLL